MARFQPRGAIGRRQRPAGSLFMDVNYAPLNGRCEEAGRDRYAARRPVFISAAGRILAARGAHGRTVAAD